VRDIDDPDLSGSTRSGKVMSRILRKIAAPEYGWLGDTSTVAAPTFVDLGRQPHDR
jgi:acetyl-CoA synthetase